MKNKTIITLYDPDTEDTFKLSINVSFNTLKETTKNNTDNKNKWLYLIKKSYKGGLNHGY